MALIPDNETEQLDAFIERFQEDRIEPSLTYRLNFNTGRISGMINNEEALMQFIRKALATFRGYYAIYSEDYGSELEGLIGQDVTPAFLEAEVPRMVRETLIYDDRINDVTDISVSRTGDQLLIACTVVSIYGEFQQEVIV